MHDYNIENLIQGKRPENAYRQYHDDIHFAISFPILNSYIPFNDASKGLILGEYDIRNFTQGRFIFTIEDIFDLALYEAAKLNNPSVDKRNFSVFRLVNEFPLIYNFVLYCAYSTSISGQGFATQMVNNNLDGGLANTITNHSKTLQTLNVQSGVVKIFIRQMIYTIAPIITNSSHLLEFFGKIDGIAETL